MSQTHPRPRRPDADPDDALPVNPMRIAAWDEPTPASIAVRLRDRDFGPRSGQRGPSPLKGRKRGIPPDAFPPPPAPDQVPDRPAAADQEED